VVKTSVEKHALSRCYVILLSCLYTLKVTLHQGCSGVGTRYHTFLH